MKTLYLLSLIFILNFSSQASVWKNKRTWNLEEEKRYSQWVKDNWKSDVFTNKESPYYGIPTDCADAAYAMRAIYSYTRNLPFQIYSTRIKKIISNKMSRWDKNPDKYREHYYPDVYQEIEPSRSIRIQAERVIDTWKSNNVVVPASIKNKSKRIIKEYLKTHGDDAKVPFEVRSKANKIILDYKDKAMKTLKVPDSIKEEAQSKIDDYIAKKRRELQDKKDIQVSHWNSIETIQEKKLWLFLQYLFQLTSTWTLPVDTMGVSISKEGIVPGIVLLTRRQHAMEIVDVDDYGIITTLGSNLPVKVRDLKLKKSFEIKSLYYYEEGALKFRWPSEYGNPNKNNNSTPAYRLKRNSGYQYQLWEKMEDKQIENLKAETLAKKEKLETETDRHKVAILKNDIADNKQYLKLFNTYIAKPRWRKKRTKTDIAKIFWKLFDVKVKRLFEKEVVSKIAKIQETEEMKLNRLHNIICEYAKERVAVVDSAIEYSHNLGICMEAVDYHNYSTPSRDSKLKNYFEDLYYYIQRLKKHKNWDNITNEELRNYFDELIEVPEKIITTKWIKAYPQLIAGEEHFGMKGDPFKLNSEYQGKCMIDIRNDGNPIDLRQLKLRMSKGWLSSDPNAPIEARWGENPSYKPTCSIETN